MSQKNKPFVANNRVWQRHALAKACALALAGAGAVAQAAVVPGAALLTNYGTISSVVEMAGSLPWSAGYNSNWVNSETQAGDISVPILNSSIGSSLTPADALGGFSATFITGNSILAPGLGNEGFTPITTLNRVSATDDGILSLNLQIFTGLVDTSQNPDAYLNPSSVSASLINTALTKPGTVYLTQTGLSAANLSLSSNVMGASATLNTLNATVAVATPAAYTSTSKGSSSLAFDSDSMQMGTPGVTPTSGSTGSVNLSNMQGVFNATGSAEVTDVKAVMKVSETDGDLSSTISANSNSIAATTINNTAVSIFRATADSAAFTGTVGVTNLQSTNIVEVTATQLAQVTGSGVSVDLREGTAATAVTGAVTVSDNTVSAAVTGNAAGSQSASGSIAAGNAIVFEGSSNITGVNTTRGAGGELQAAITGGTSQAQADLLINSVQRNSGNTFTGSLGTTTITSNLDTLSSTGSLTQSGNSLSAAATNNLAGNLISAGQTGSVGSITASAVLLNSQNNDTVTTLAETQSAGISSTVGATGETVTGSVTLKDNAISATAQGNTSGNTVLLKADNLNVGAIGESRSVTLTPETTSASSGLAVSALNVQTNSVSTLDAKNQGGNVSLSFAVGATGINLVSTQATLDSNRLTSAASANTAVNQVNLQSTNAPGLNTGLGNLQSNTNVSTTAISGVSTTDPLTVALSAGTATGSKISLSSNTISAQAQLNNANNSLSIASTTSSGSGTLAPSLKAGDLMDDTATANADVVLVNAQLNTATSPISPTSASATTYGEITASTGALGTATALVAGNNQIMALAEGNVASNALGLNNGTMSNTTVALVSAQRGAATDITGSTNAAITTVTGSVSGASTITANDNAIKSIAVSNTVSNSLSVTATNATGVGVSVAPTVDYNLTQMTAVADLAMVSQQKTDGSEISATTGSGTPSQIALTSGAVSQASNLTFNTNTVSATAFANNATNAATVSVGNLSGMTTAAGNAQLVGAGTVAASADGEVLLTAASLNASNVSADRNAITSTARANTAENSLLVTATTASGRGTQSGFTVTDDITTADHVLSNAQGVLNNPVTATTVGDVKLTSTGAVSASSNLSLNNSTVSAYGSSNYANNLMTLDVTNASNATSALVSMQASNRTVAADAVTANATGTVALQAGEVIASGVSMAGNAIKSTALDNVVNNEMNLKGSTLLGASGLSMSGLESSITQPSTASVAADAMLVNMQASANGTLKATTGVDASTPAVVSLVVDGVNTGTTGTATVSSKDNSIVSLALANNAVNQLGLTVSNITDITSALSNSQQVDGGVLAAATFGTVQLSVTDAVNAASLTLGTSSIASTAVANESTNKLTVNATDVVGRDLGSRKTNAGALAVVADFALGNEQQIVSGTTLSATTTGDVKMDLSTNAVGTSNLALSDSTLSAYGSANNANNLLSMTSTNISQSSLGLASSQSMDAASEVNSTVTGSIAITAGAATDANLSVTGNSVKSTALGNVAGNSLNVTAASYTGPSALASITTQAGSAGTSSTSDIAIASVQTNSSTDVISAETKGTVQMTVGAVEKDAGTSSNSLTGNSLKALAQSNSVSNDIQLKVTQLTDASAGLASYQNSTAAVSASLLPNNSGLFVVTSGDLTGGSVTVSGNTASALAGINEAFNTLTVSGANVLGRTGQITVPVVGTASSTNADFAMMNVQTASTSADANVSLGTSGFSTTGLISGGSVAVMGNEVLARASANTANNALNLSGSNQLQASGVVNNVQTMVDATTVTAKVETGSLGANFGSTAPVDGAVVSVKDNTVTAQATGNVANNALNASATTGIASAGSNATSPTFAVLNSQSIGASATIQSTIDAITVGSTQINGALNGGSFTASGNKILSVAYGNSASSAVNVAALTPGLNTASASITNVQYNMASISAAVSGVNIEGTGKVSINGGSVNISGNSITAMAVGNRSVGSISGR